jgi:hypothetical protein
MIALNEKKQKGRMLDSLARKYARTVMQHITSPESTKALEKGEVIDDYIELKPLGLNRPNIHGIELEIDANLDMQGVASSGGYQIVPGEPEISYISVSISLPKPFNRKHLSKLYDELLEIMRHEIEHAQQDPERIDAISDFADDPFGSKQSMLNYFGSPEEVAGWVTGWMKKAKQKRKPLKKVIQHQLDLIKDQAKWEGMDEKEVDEAGEELLRRFVKYSLERYPKQKI